MLQIMLVLLVIAKVYSELYGLAAPAIAAGFTALAPTLGALVPRIGADGFLLSRQKNRHRICGRFCCDCFITRSKPPFRGLAVGIMISGLIFEDEDFVRPWEGYQENLEGYITSLPHLGLGYCFHLLKWLFVL
ncbi:hypothetical protein Syun_003247 [Stephania yunnanensis]|uniref:Uncharacterized protein n=1 Tax=Stephania yunnanensis TaxID=152371 RepID=A0AAP0L3F0_9MAGN